MTTQQMEEHSQGLEARVASLENELAQMKQILSGFAPKSPWWSKVAGSYDPTFDEAVDLGKEWRKSAE